MGGGFGGIGGGMGGGGFDSSSMQQQPMQQPDFSNLLNQGSVTKSNQGRAQRIQEVLKGMHNPPALLKILTPAEEIAQRAEYDEYVRGLTAFLLEARLVGMLHTLCSTHQTPECLEWYKQVYAEYEIWKAALDPKEWLEEVQKPGKLSTITQKQQDYLKHWYQLAVYFGERPREPVNFHVFYGNADNHLGTEARRVVAEVAEAAREAEVVR